MDSVPLVVRNADFESVPLMEHNINNTSSPSATAAMVQLIIILVLNKIYGHIAIILTDMELPRTNSEYTDNFAIKMYMFEFVNFYLAIFYVAFFKSELGGWPGSYHYSAGYRVDKCDPSGCVIELCIQVCNSGVICGLWLAAYLWFFVSLDACIFPIPSICGMKFLLLYCTFYYVWYFVFSIYIDPMVDNS